jgi:CubicO group peptidase (beta-lactamase class C family)
MNGALIFKRIFFGTIFTITGLVILWNLLTPSTIHPPKEVESVEDILSYIKQMNEEKNPPSLNITVIKDGKVVFNEGHGLANPFDNLESNEEIIYQLWDQTKIFTAVAIFKLIEQQKLNLQTNVSEILNYFNVKGIDGKDYKVNIRQLLNHSSGLPDFLYNGGLNWIHLHNERTVNQTQFLKNILPNHSVLHFEPGKGTSFSNTSYIVLGAIIEKLSGMSYEDFVLKNIIKPLRLKNTNFYYTDLMLANSALGSSAVVSFYTPILMKHNENWFDKYVIETKDLRMWLRPYNPDYTASSGLIGTSYDMAQFGQMMLNGGILNNVRILKKESIDTLLYKGSREEDKLDPKLGLGFKTWKFNDSEMIGHGGGGPGFGSHLMIDVKRKLVISIAANDTAVDRFSLMKTLTRLDW